MGPFGDASTFTYSYTDIWMYLGSCFKQGRDPSNHIATVQGATPPNSSSLDRGDCPHARKPCPPLPACSSGHHTPSFHPAVHTDITGGYAGGTT